MDMERMFTLDGKSKIRDCPFKIEMRQFYSSEKIGSHLD